MQRSLAHELSKFTDPNSESQLFRLEELLSFIEPSACGEAEFTTLLQVFERFPEHDGFGIFWSIVHLLEACTGYEKELVRSVRRKPVEFNLTMVNRLLNAGVHEVGGQPLDSLLGSVEESQEANQRAKQVARSFMQRSASRGGAGA